MFKSLATKIRMSSPAQSSVLNRSIIANQVGNVSYPLTPAESTEDILFDKYANSAIHSRFKTVENTIYEKIVQLNAEYDECQPFYVCDIGEVKRQLNLWKSELPFVQPYYAVKCNPNYEFVKVLAQFGVGFDCASQNEIKTVFNAHSDLNLKVNTDNLIYANPIKPISHLKFANSLNVNLTTVDSMEEVEKLANFTEGMDVLIRITTDDSTATCPLSIKFGADVLYSTEIINKCIELGINIRGVAFHVGSGFKDATTLSKAVKDARVLWDYINEKQFNKCDTLDIGGGFCKEYFAQPAKLLNRELQNYFNSELLNNEIKVISELGRFLSQSCFTLTTNVIGVRKELNGNKVRIYLNDGLYGNLNCVLFDHQEVEPLVVTSRGNFVFNDTEVNEQNNKQYSIWGPTCDGLDCIKQKCSLTHDIQTGDWIGFKNAGAYTNAAATNFNGFTNEFECIFIDTEI